MPRQETRTLYTLAEIKAQFPDAYAKIERRWEKRCDQSEDVPHREEMIESLNKLVGLFGKLTDWKIGPYAPSSLSVELNEAECTNPNEDSMPEFPTDLEIVTLEFAPLWHDRWVFGKGEQWQSFCMNKKASTHLRQIVRDFPDDVPVGAIRFTGVCPLTGVCWDDDLAEYVYWAVRTGYSTLEGALEELAIIVSKMMEAECEYEREEGMESTWEDREFTEDGKEV